MNEKCEFLGQCHSPNSIRGCDVTDRKQVWIGDTNYNYSLDSDSEMCARHAIVGHQGPVSREIINDVRRQLNLCPEHFEDAPIVVPKVTLEKPLKTAKKTLKKVAKKSKR